MKKIIYSLVSLLLLVGCRYDDTEIWNELQKQNEKILALQELCTKMNNNITSLQSIVEALQKNDYVTSVTPIVLDGVEIGYTISFTQSAPITIYHGKDGHTPIVGVKQDSDGQYYWTIDNEWVFGEDGEKVKAEGIDAVTPQLKIVDEYWYISYDNGENWSILGKATGEDGDTLFKTVEVDGEYVHIILTDGTEFTFKREVEKPALLSVTFKAIQNPSILIEDLNLEIQDGICEGLIPHIVPNKMLIPVFEISGKELCVNKEPITSGNTQLDFSRPVKFDVVGSHNDTVSYTVNVRAFTGLPVMTINTLNGAGVTSKSTYVEATFKIVEDITTKASGDVFEAAGKIKGRGNSTWAEKKKPYKIKFNEKVSLFGEAKDKEWVLLANHLDCSFVRNKIAMFMGEKSSLAYSTSLHYVELILNNVYLGTYQVAEQQKISEGRVNVTDNGFLIEVDAKAESGDITFRLGTIPQPLNIKDPEMTVGSEQYNNVVNFMTTVENALYGENWLDPENGWKKYMDMDSFVDWYLINEISRNNDAIFFTSCYMHAAPNGKLFMGPLWDYDLAFGNYSGNSSKYEGFYIKDNIGWYIRLFADPAFKQRVKERFDYFYSLKDEIMSEINDNASYLELSAIENNNKWGILYNPHSYGYMIPGSYYNEVNYLKQWLNNRFEWLKNAYSQL